MTGDARESRRGPLLALVVSGALLVGSAAVAPWILDRPSVGGAGGGPGWAGGPAAGPAVPGRPGGFPGAVRQGAGRGPGLMSGGMMAGGMMAGGMMAGQVWLAGDGVAVTSIGAARARAAAAVASAGLRPGEVVQFADNFYVELKDASGASVTEVLVDPWSGVVGTKPGPATMWNTGSRTPRLTADQATAVAAQWLQANRPGETVSTADAYPGYYTLDTQAAGNPSGMLSVNATTGAVWYHTWHGAFVAREDS